MDRATIAETVHRKLGKLSTDAGLSTTSAGSQTEGSYTDAIDAALRQLGAYDSDTLVLDATLVPITQYNTLLRIVEGEMLERLLRHYALDTDIKTGQREEKLSQISAAIRAFRSSGSSSGGSGPVIVRPLIRKATDYEFE